MCKLHNSSVIACNFMLIGFLVVKYRKPGAGADYKKERRTNCAARTLDTAVTMAAAIWHTDGGDTRGSIRRTANGLEDCRLNIL